MNANTEHNENTQDILAQLGTPIKEAMKAKDRIRLDALRYIKAKLMENKVAEKPVGQNNILITLQKKTKEAIALYPDGSEQKIKAEKELQVIAEFLPKPLTAPEIESMIEDLASNLPNANMGQIMKGLSPLIRGRFDGKEASKLVQTYLQK